MAIYLVCEGPSDGLDVRVLNLIIAQKLAQNVQVIATGGDSSLSSVRSWLEERSRTLLSRGNWSPPHDRAYVIEDRNFRLASEVELGWQEANRTRWIWRRCEIENYLLDPRLIARAFQEIKKVPIAQKFASNLPDTELKALNLLQQLARQMLEDHVGQLICQQLNFYKGNTANMNLRCPQRVPHVGSTYASRTDWLTHLDGECQRLKQACLQINGDTKFDLSSITTEYDRSLAEVNAPEFLKGQFLVDMAGKELMNAFLTYIRTDIGIARLTYPVLVKELLKVLDELYQPGFFDPDDFAELAKKLV